MSPPPASSGSKDGDERTPEQVWRENFDAFERAIGKPIEEFLNSNEFADAAAAMIKANVEMRRRFERAAPDWPNLWGMPGQADVAEVKRGIDEIKDLISQLSDRLTAVEAKLSR
jgi:hypothetical protein